MSLHIQYSMHISTKLIFCSWYLIIVQHSVQYNKTSLSKISLTSYPISILPLSIHYILNQLIIYDRTYHYDFYLNPYTKIYNFKIVWL